MKKNYSLQELNLEGKVSEIFINIKPKFIFKFLDNDIGDDGFTYLLAAMTINDSLQTIKLNGNKFIWISLILSFLKHFI